MAAGIVWLINRRSGTAVDDDQRILAARPSPNDRASGTAAPLAGKAQPAGPSLATTVEPAPPAPADDPARPLAPRDNPTSNLALAETPPQPVGIQDEPAVRDSVAPDPAKEHPKGGPPDKIAEKPKTAEKPKAAAPAEPKRSEPPGKEAQDAADKPIQGLFRAEFDQANRGAADVKLALAKKLLQQALDTSDDPAGRFLLFQRARDYAAAAGNVSETMAAIDKLAEHFLIDAPSEKFAALSVMAKSLRSPEAMQAALDAALAATDDAITGDNYDIAAKLVRIALGLAAKLHNPQLVAQLKPRPAEIEQLKKEFAKAAEALDKLKSNPDDPEANFLVGNFQGPLKGDFDKALPYLAKGSDATLKDLAKAEMANPTESAKQTTLADGWIGASEKSKLGAEKLHLQARAAMWYRQALPHLSGLEKVRVEALVSRLEQAAKPLPISAKDFVHQLTESAWTVTWLPNPGSTDKFCKSGWVYKAMVFSPDGTCDTSAQANGGAYKGKWTQENGPSVVVVYPGFPQYLQRYTLTRRGHLDAQHYDPADKLQCRGVGSKVGSKNGSDR
jgi:hypothetical protein